MITRRQALALASTLLVSTAAFSAGTAAAEQPAERLKIRLALSGGTTEGFGYRIAKSLGYLEDENLEVDEQYVESRTLARDAVSNGQVDITNTGITTTLRAIEQGRPVRVVSGVVALNPIYIVASADFLEKNKATKADWKSWKPEQRVKFLVDNDARWASSIPGSLTDFVSQNQLKHFGVDPATQINIHYFPSPASAVESFAQGKVADAVITSEVNLVRLARLLGEKSHTDLPLVLSREEIAEHVPGSLVPGEQWIVNTDVANREAVVRFLRAYLKGTNYFLSKPVPEIAQIILKDNPDIVSEQAKQALEDSVAFNYRATPANGKLTDEQVRAAIEFSLGQGQIKGQLKNEQVIDYSYIDDASKGVNIVQKSPEAGR